MAMREGRETDREVGSKGRRRKKTQQNLTMREGEESDRVSDNKGCA